MKHSFEELPTVDIGGLRSPNRQDRLDVAGALKQAAHEVGFFYISGHSVPDGLFADLTAAAVTFFELAAERKMQWYIGTSTNHSGYVPEGEEVFADGKVDRKEAFDVNVDWTGGDRPSPMMGPQLWPDVLLFKDRVSAYYRAMADLARHLFEGFALAFDLPETYFARFLTVPPSQLRLIHYPFDPNPISDQQGIGSHTDYECFTILRGTAPGLEVLNGNGAWIDAPPLPGAYVINIGDMLEAWTNGEFVATSHRVRKVAEERYSFPYFATVDYWTVVEPLPRFVAPERPAAFPAIVSGEHLFAQTVRTFRYLQQRQVEGLVTVGAGAYEHNFGQASRLLPEV